jgi:putative phosphoesterase
MRIAVISDMHGNCLALDKALGDIEQQRVDQIVCLGDAIQGGPQPAQTVQRLRELGCPVVMGNADAWLLTAEETGAEKTTEQQLRVREWSLAQLSAQDKEFIEGFQPTVEIGLDGGRKLLCFHGSPGSFDDIILPETPEETVMGWLGQYAGAVMCGGHTHLQQVRRITDRFFFNPGSIGLVYDRHQPEEGFRLDPWAEYAILTSAGEQVSLEFRRVPYDVADLVRVYQQSGRPGAETMIGQYQP